jgi:glucose-1-phosphate cytidylyltransferase
MKVVILAGGYGLRLLEETRLTPKPMIKIGGKPILWHLIKYFNYFGINEFIIAAGYKSIIVEDYFKKVRINNSVISVVNTGINTMTGGRLKRLESIIGKEQFIMTYGDGLSNINIKKLIKFHNQNKKIATVTAVCPPARWGAIEIKNNNVISFQEKSKMHEGRINGGFFILDSNIFKFIPNKDNIIFEKDVVKILVKKKEINAYLHNGFWQCMDTLREKNILEELWKKKPPWKMWS